MTDETKARRTRDTAWWLLAAGLFAAALALAAMTPAPGPAQLDGPPRRIVSLAPHATEILFALGAGDRVAGVTQFCTWPPAARALPRVGGFKGKSLEAIVALDPDLVIGTRDGNEEQIFLALQRLGIPTLTTQPSTVEQAIGSLLEVAAAVGREDAGRELAADMRARVQAVRDRVAGAPRPRVLFVYGREPLVLAGPGTFADDLIRLAGGDNLAADARMPYPRFSLETVVARAPEVIIEGAMGSETDGQALAWWSRLPSLPAVQSRRVVLIDEDLIARPGPRIILGLERIAAALHPERFPEAGP